MFYTSQDPTDKFDQRSFEKHFSATVNRSNKLTSEEPDWASEEPENEASRAIVELELAEPFRALSSFCIELRAHTGDQLRA